MIDLRAFRRINSLTQDALGNYLGIKKSFISRIESGQVNLPKDKYIKLLNNDRGWDTTMIEGDKISIGQNNSGVIVNGDNENSPIDNRHYYSDSPDVLRAQIEVLDARIKEKDAQIKEKDAQINKLLDILSQRH